jgi:hypothetical protein
VDVRIATCRKNKDTKAILDELEQGVGFVACNTQVIGLLREALWLLRRGRRWGDC